MDEQAQTLKALRKLGLPASNIQPSFCDDDDGPQLRPRNDSLLQRLNRIDNILSIMEESDQTEPSSSSTTSPRPTTYLYSDLQKRCKPTMSVLEEVVMKGTLVERIAELETRLMKLQRMLSLKSNGKTQSPCAYTTDSSHHRRVMSCGEMHDKCLLQDLIDAERREAMQFHSDRIVERPCQAECFADSSICDPHLEKLDCPNGMHDEDVATGKDVKQQFARARPKLPKKNGTQIKQWLWKRLPVHLTKTSNKGKIVSHLDTVWATKFTL